MMLFTAASLIRSICFSTATLMDRSGLRFQHRVAALGQGKALSPRGMREQVLGLDLRAKKVTAGARRNASARRLLCRRGRTQVCRPELALAMRPCPSRLSHAVQLYSAGPGRTAGKRAEPILVYELGRPEAGWGTPDASFKRPSLGPHQPPYLLQRQPPPGCIRKSPRSGC